MVGNSDPRVTWNLFVQSLSKTISLWDEHRALMAEVRGSLVEAEHKHLLYDFWRSPFIKMIDRFLAFYQGWDFKDLVIVIPKETKQEPKGGK